MFRTTRVRGLFAGLAVTVGVASFGGSLLTSAQALTSYGATPLERAEALRVALDAYTEAVRSCDLNTAREAYEDVETVFNAVEIDHQFLSPEQYMFFAHTYIRDHVPSGLGLQGDEPYSCATNERLATGQAEAWTRITELIANSPDSGPLFDDVAALRTVNQGIRLARAELAGNPDATPQTDATAPDPEAAAGHWAEFVADYPTARPLVAFRNEALATEIDGLVAAVTAAFDSGGDAAAALATLAGRYELGIDLVTAAARNSVPSQSTQPVFADEHFSSIDFLGDIVLTFFEIRDLIAAGTPAAAAQVQVEYNDWLRYPLSFKTGDVLTRANVAVETAIADYVAAQTPTSTQVLLDALLIVEQVFVGQYWGTPELIDFYVDNDGGFAGPAPVAETLVAALNPDANVPPGPAGATDVNLHTTAFPNGLLRSAPSAQ